MFLYLVFILLPATALAECHNKVYNIFFESLDEDADGNANRTECYDMFAAFDPDGDGEITLDDIKKYAPVAAPVFVGVEPLIRDFADFNSDGIIKHDDTDKTLRDIDTDQDGFMTPVEFQSYVAKYCANGEQHDVE